MRYAWCRGSGYGSWAAKAPLAALGLVGTDPEGSVGVVARDSAVIRQFEEPDNRARTVRILRTTDCEIWPTALNGYLIARLSRSFQAPGPAVGKQIGVTK